MPKLFSPLAAGQIKAPAAILDGILAGSWPLLKQGKFGLENISPSEVSRFSKKLDKQVLPLHNALKELHDLLTKALENYPPPEVRMTLWELAREALRHWISKECYIEKVRMFIGKINNGIRVLVHIYHQSGCRAD